MLFLDSSLQFFSLNFQISMGKEIYYIPKDDESDKNNLVFHVILEPCYFPFMVGTQYNLIFSLF